MNVTKRWMYLPLCLLTILLTFMVTSLVDVVLAVFYPRFYSSVLFVVSFGVGGVFAAVLGYGKAINASPLKNEMTRWSTIVSIWITALLFIFLLSVLEGGEYKLAFISFGITMALSALLFVKGKVEF